MSVLKWALPIMIACIAAGYGVWLKTSIPVSHFIIPERDRDVQCRPITENKDTFVVINETGFTATNEFVFSLSFKDQLMNAAVRIRSLQCWARQWNMSVVEPFVEDTFFRMPVHQDIHEVIQSRFRHFFSLSRWNSVGAKYNFWSLASWEHFLKYASRDVILVYVVYRTAPKCLGTSYSSSACDFQLMRDFSAKFLARNHFRVFKEVCIDMTQLSFLDPSRFSSLVFGSHFSEKSTATVIFNEWRGIANHSEKTCYINMKINQCVYKHLYDISLESLTPNSLIAEKAQLFISKYLKTRFGYNAVLIRWEKIFISWREHHSTKIRECGQKLENHLKELETLGLNSTFLTTDVGKYGSLSFHRQDQAMVNATAAKVETQRLLRYIHGRPFSVEEYDKRYEEILNSTNPIYISQLQQAIAARACCLLLVGPKHGLFQRHTLLQYRQIHRTDYCYKFLEC